MRNHRIFRVLATIGIFASHQFALAAFCDFDQCLTCGDEWSLCQAAIDYDCGCAELDFGVIACVFACVDAALAAIKDCEAAYNDCGDLYCEINGICQIRPSEPEPEDPTPEPDPVPDPEPAPEDPIDPPTPGSPAPPPAMCRNFYRSQSCPVPYSSRCLSRPGRGQKLVRGVEPTYNGCGALANDLGSSAVRVALDTFAGDFQDSCNNHDICFGTCSFGDDSQFDDCNLNFLSQMLAACETLYPVISGSEIGNTVNLIRGATCVSQATFVYSAVQESSQGCSAYESAQIQACVCVDCDDVPMETRTISTANPVTNAAAAFKGSAPNIVADWTDFVSSLGSAITATGTSLLGQTLSSFANQIGYRSSTPSAQMKALAASSGEVNRRATGARYRRQSTTKLSSYFTSLNLDSSASYGCISGSDQSVCKTAIALLSIARIARALDLYGINTVPPPNESNTTTDSQILPISTSSSASTVTSVSIETTTSVSVTSSSSSDSPSVILTQISTSSLPIGDSPSALTSSTWSTVYAASSSSTSMSGPAPPGSACTLVKVYGDSPDTPDSPDGMPEITEIPDYPGGYYYLCSDGSIPPLAILPPINDVASPAFSSSSGILAPTTAVIASHAPEQTRPVSSFAASASCKPTKIYGDSPDTPDTPDSPDGQPEIPEIPETPQGSEDGAYHLSCI